MQKICLENMFKNDFLKLYYRRINLYKNFNMIPFSYRYCFNFIMQISNICDAYTMKVIYFHF